MKKSSLAGMHILQKRHQDLLSFPEIAYLDRHQEQRRHHQWQYCPNYFCPQCLQRQSEKIVKVNFVKIFFGFYVTLNGFADATGA